jgi:hypothetical protein
MERMKKASNSVEQTAPSCTTRTDSRVALAGANLKEDEGVAIAPALCHPLPRRRAGSLSGRRTPPRKHDSSPPGKGIWPTHGQTDFAFYGAGALLSRRAWV